MLGGSKVRWKEYVISEQNNRNVMCNTECIFQDIIYVMQIILQTSWSSGQQPKEGQVGEEKESLIVSCTA